MAHSLKAALRAPEGKWVLAAERRATTNFVPDMSVQLTIAAPSEHNSGSAEAGRSSGDAAPELVLFNTQHFLYICHPQAVDRVSLLRLGRRLLPECMLLLLPPQLQWTPGPANATPLCHPSLQEPLRVVDFRHLGAGAGGPVYPTCHAHTPTSKDEFDTAVGLSTGEGEEGWEVQGDGMTWSAGAVHWGG